MVCWLGAPTLLTCGITLRSWPRGHCLSHSFKSCGNAGRRRPGGVGLCEGANWDGRDACSSTRGPAATQAPQVEVFCEPKDEKETTATGAKPTRPRAFPTATTRAAATNGCTLCRTAVEQDSAPPCRSWSNGETTRRIGRRQAEDNL